MSEVEDSYLRVRQRQSGAPFGERKLKEAEFCKALWQELWMSVGHLPSTHLPNRPFHFDWVMAADRSTFVAFDLEHKIAQNYVSLVEGFHIYLSTHNEQTNSLFPPTSEDDFVEERNCDARSLLILRSAKHAVVLHQPTILGAWFCKYSGHKQSTFVDNSDTIAGLSQGYLVLRTRPYLNWK